MFALLLSPAADLFMLLSLANLSAQTALAPLVLSSLALALGCVIFVWMINISRLKIDIFALAMSFDVPSPAAAKWVTRELAEAFARDLTKALECDLVQLMAVRCVSK